jgi:hypothetical protein
MTNKYKKINIDDLNRADEEIKKSRVYSKDDELVTKIVKKFPKHNCNVEETAMKIAVIDVANSTRLNMHKKTISIYDLAKKISEIQGIDERLKNGDKELVSEIANLYKKPIITSFASKYCAIHNQVVYGEDKFCKYDELVKTNLNLYVEVKKTKLNHNYLLYHEKIMEIINANGLADVPQIKKKIDQFIWWDAKNKD